MHPSARLKIIKLFHLNLNFKKSRIIDFSCIIFLSEVHDNSKTREAYQPPIPRPPKKNSRFTLQDESERKPQETEVLNIYSIFLGNEYCTAVFTNIVVKQRPGLK